MIKKVDMKEGSFSRSGEQEEKWLGINALKYDYAGLLNILASKYWLWGHLEEQVSYAPLFSRMLEISNLLNSTSSLAQRMNLNISTLSINKESKWNSTEDIINPSTSDYSPKLALLNLEKAVGWTKIVQNEPSNFLTQF